MFIFFQNHSELQRLTRGESVSEYRVFKTTLAPFPDQLESLIRPVCPKVIFQKHIQSMLTIFPVLILWILWM